MAKRSKKQKTVAERQPVGSGCDWLWALGLILAVVAAYQPVWRAGFIWDDDNHLTANPVIVGPLGLKEIWTTGAARFFPLTLTTFWLEHFFWGLNPLPYHLVNVLQHAASAVLLWRVLLVLRVPGAWLGAALWALHPVEVESVAWIAEMKNTQSTLFYLLTIWFFVQWQKNEKSTHYVLTLLCAALAMLSKSSTVILPLVLCLCAWWMEGKWQWRNLTRVAPLFLMSVGISLLTVQAVKLEGLEGPQWVQSWPERLVTAGEAIWFYLGKLIWPHPLITIYPRWAIDAAQPLAYLPLVLVVAALALFGFYRKTWARPWFFAMAYFVTALLPVLGLVNHNYLQSSFVADHFQYLAAMGPLALAAAGLCRFVPETYALRWSLCGGLLLALGLMSWQRAFVYESQVTLWTDALAKNPDSWIGHNNLGDALVHGGHVDEAMAHYQKALEISPNLAVTYNNMGTALEQEGRLDEAVTAYQKALELRSDFAEAEANLAEARARLGLEFFEKGRMDEAILQYQQALQIDPNAFAVRCDLGNALVQSGHVEEGIAEYQRALALNPSSLEAHCDLGNALVKTGRLDEAIAEYHKALEINSDSAAVHANLGIILLKKGDANDAITQFQEVLRLNPNDAAAQTNLAKAQAMVGKQN